MLKDIFSVPVYKTDCFINEELKQSIINQFYKIESEMPIEPNSYPVGSYTSFNKIVHIFDEVSELAPIKNSALAAATDIHNQLELGGTLKFTSSWFAINRKNSYHEEHHHAPNVWSGVYYLQAEPGDANFIFVNKNLTDSSWPYSAPKIGNNNFISNEMVASPYSGMLILFPSYLHHKVSQQLQDRERIMIAFNLDVKNV